MNTASLFKKNIQNIVYTDKEPSLLVHFAATAMRTCGIKHVFGYYAKKRTIGHGDLYNDKGQFMWSNEKIKSERLDLRKDPDWSLLRH